MDWGIYLDILVNWANHKGYAIEFGNDVDDCICEITKLIEINSSHSLETQVIRLLHECGHVLIFENGSIYDFPEKKKYSKNTMGHKVFTIIEEIEAWKRAKKLACQLNIPIEEDIWEKAMIKALYNYIQWAGNTKE